MGAWQPKDPALMQWVWPDRVHLQRYVGMAATEQGFARYVSEYVNGGG